MRKGIGIYKEGKYKAKVGDKHTKEYRLWFAMLDRCYSKSYQETQDTYRGCSVSKEFLDFQYFAEWCNNQVGFDEPDWQLDKDIISSGNKVYSENTCCFLPRKLNAFLWSTNKRTKYPRGVSYDKSGRGLKRFRATCGDLKKGRVNLGRYATEEEAFSVYKDFKELLIKEVADLWKDKIDERAYLGLMTYEV